MKKCSKCNTEKENTDFTKGNICKVCWSEGRKLYYQKNKEVIIKQQLERYHTDKTKAKETYLLNKDKVKVKNAEYYKLNKVAISKKKQETHVKRMQSDSLYKLIYNLRRLINQSLKNKGFVKNKRTHQILGCSYEDFKIYLESKFEPWMNWNNKGLYNGELNYGWDIDHIIPLSSAKTEEDLYKLNHYTNLQPLCSKVNRDIKKNLIK